MAGTPQQCKPITVGPKTYRMCTDQSVSYVELWSRQMHSFNRELIQTIDEVIHLEAGLAQ